MPGNVDTADDAALHGWARHPAHPGYPLTVHAIAAGRVVATTLADRPRGDGLPGFVLDLPPANPIAHTQVLLGETGELLPLPGSPKAPPRLLRVEDLIATPAPRRWITGACVIDAEAAGLLPATIIDLLCRDHLGHAAGPVITASAMTVLQDGGYTAVRRLFIDSTEGRLRRPPADRAAGACFSDPLIMRVAAQDASFGATDELKVTQVSAAILLQQDGRAFVTECYRRLLRKEPDPAGMAHYVGQLAEGVSKTSIIRHLSNDFETIAAGITVVDLPDED